MVDFPGVAGGGKHGAVGQREKVKDGVGGQRQAGDGLAVVHEVECGGGGGAEQQVAIRERQKGGDLGLGDLDDLSDRVAAVLGLECDFLDAPVRPGADDKTGGAIFLRTGRAERPEDVADFRAGEIGDDRTRQNASVRAGGEALEVATGDVPAEIHLQRVRQRIGRQI